MIYVHSILSMPFPKSWKTQERRLNPSNSSSTPLPVAQAGLWSGPLSPLAGPGLSAWYSLDFLLRDGAAFSNPQDSVLQREEGGSVISFDLASGDRQYLFSWVLSKKSQRPFRIKERKIHPTLR